VVLVVVDDDVTGEPRHVAVDVLRQEPIGRRGVGEARRVVVQQPVARRPEPRLVLGDDVGRDLSRQIDRAGEVRRVHGLADDAVGGIDVEDPEGFEARIADDLGEGGESSAQRRSARRASARLWPGTLWRYGYQVRSRGPAVQYERTRRCAFPQQQEQFVLRLFALRWCRDGFQWWHTDQFAPLARLGNGLALIFPPHRVARFSDSTT